MRPDYGSGHSGLGDFRILVLFSSDQFGAGFCQRGHVAGYLGGAFAVAMNFKEPVGRAVGEYVDQLASTQAVGSLGGFVCRDLCWAVWLIFYWGNWLARRD